MGGLGHCRFCAGDCEELTLDLRVERALVVAPPGPGGADVIIGESLRLTGLQRAKKGLDLNIALTALRQWATTT